MPPPQTSTHFLTPRSQGPSNLNPDSQPSQPMASNPWTQTLTPQSLTPNPHSSVLDPHFMLHNPHTSHHPAPHAPLIPKPLAQIPHPQTLGPDQNPWPRSLHPPTAYSQRQPALPLASIPCPLPSPPKPSPSPPIPSPLPPPPTTRNPFNEVVLDKAAVWAAAARLMGEGGWRLRKAFLEEHR